MSKTVVVAGAVGLILLEAVLVLAWAAGYVDNYRALGATVVLFLLYLLVKP